MVKFTWGGKNMNGDYVVRKSNYFIMNSSYDLSLEEQKIILTLASMVRQDDEDFKPYNFKISEFIKLLGIEDKSKYTEIPRITKELMKKVFEIQEGDTLIQTSWLSGAKYKKGTGYVELTFSPYLKPYMLKLNKLYTSYKLINVLRMKSKYSPRIYEILKCNEFKTQKYVEIEINELRKLLKSEDIYPLYADFKRKVIEKAKKELKELTDISFDYEEIKTGRKVTALRFKINSNENNEIAATVDDNPPRLFGSDSNDDIDKIKLVQALIKVENGLLPELSARAILKAANNDIEKIKEKYKVVMTIPNLQNIVGALINALKENWVLMKSGKRPGGIFNNYTQRQYTAEELKKIENALRGLDELDEIEE